MFTYDIREAWQERENSRYVRVTLVFDCADIGNRHMNVERVATVLADGSDIETEVKYHARILCDWYNLRARYIGMIPK